MNNTEFIIFLLVFIRIISFVGTSPIFMIKGTPNTVKVGFGLLLSLLTFKFAGYDPATVPGSLIALAWAAVGESIFGMSLGFISNLLIQGIRMSGQLMDIQVGFAMSGEFDPMYSGNVTVLGNLTQMTALAIFFIINGHHVLIETLIQSFEVVPLFGMHMPAEIGPFMLALFVKIMVLALKLAAPVLIVLFLTEFTMGLISRTVPQLNILMLGLPLKILVGLLVFSAVFPGLVHIYIKAFESMPLDINNFFRLFPLVMLFASGEKTEEATPKKREEAKKKGQVAKSREFISAVTLIGITVLAAALGNYGLETLESFLTGSLNNVGASLTGTGDLANLLMVCVREFLKITLPLFATVIVLGVLANVVQTGLIRSMEPLKPKLSKLNPIEGFKRMFSMKTFIELLKACASIVIVGYVTFGLIKGELYRIMKISDSGIGVLIALPREIVQSELVMVSIIVCILGVADLLYQRYAFRKELRMTKQEVKEEYKQMEGDPQIRSRIRQKQREMASRRMMHEVPNSTVVITNPTHLAVALRYEQGRDSSPIVVAKGADRVAERIKEIARDSGVPVIENKPIARALYQNAEINDSIPVEMYQAVAEVLAMVYSLKH